MELTDSVRYHEGIDEIEAFTRFNRWVMDAPLDKLLSHIRHPLIPRGVPGAACIDIQATQLFASSGQRPGQGYNAEDVCKGEF